MVGDVSFFEVKLVQEGLPIKQVVKRLRSNLKESWPTPKQTPREPQGDPACGEGETHSIAYYPAFGLHLSWEDKVIVSILTSQHLSEKLAGCLSFSLGGQVAENVQHLRTWTKSWKEWAKASLNEWYVSIIKFPQIQTHWNLGASSQHEPLGLKFLICKMRGAQASFVPF